MWITYVNNVRVDNIEADTYMEAELIARIQYGVTARLILEREVFYHAQT
jgi:hypothetical protein